jgi:hypothetical protein
VLEQRPLIAFVPNKSAARLIRQCSAMHLSRDGLFARSPYPAALPELTCLCSLEINDRNMIAASLLRIATKRWTHAGNERLTLAMPASKRQYALSLAHQFAAPLALVIREPTTGSGYSRVLDR